MFFDIGSLEFLVLVILAILVFGPEKLPKMIQDAAAFLRKIREFSDNAKRDIRSELGPDFQDFDFEDLNPRTFARKHLLNDKDEYGLKELKELTSGLDVRQDLSEATDAANGRPARRNGTGVPRPAAGGAVRLDKGTAGPSAPKDPAPYDSDAT
ncbi:sec-independent translocase [Streptomyces sp. DSM 44917]|uniref:Sec-independent protein translocase protein TatB n=1 Tax=Streptomyces boetiae TaxID=3075541 RepID=A0ABU2L877_9ACTN|nr:sec-independent translocase [Streptomyces sp. DSM 44917]MDT0307695.1 sec-independent translocase [Streptomyces sp. DSM 44917]